MRSRALNDKIAAAARTGELPPDIDTHALAACYAAVLQGMSAQARDGATTTDLRQIAAAALRAWPQTPGQEVVASTDAATK